ncbi:MAG: hypothetical protein ACK4YM_05840 [Novosphingobium sp.]
MNPVTRLLLPLAALAAPVAAFVAPAQAQTLRVPSTGSPAIEIATPANWKGETDQDGNLTLMANDASGAILLTVIKPDAGESLPANDLLAAAFFAELGAKQSGGMTKAMFAGAPAESYKAVMDMDGFIMDVELVIRQLDGGSAALAVLMAPAGISQAQRAVNAAHFAKAKIVTR